MCRFKVAAAILASLMLAGCQTTSDNIVRIDNVPMYGQPGAERPAVLKQADEDFIAHAMAMVREHTGKTTRREASEEWWLIGEDFMGKGNTDFAMRRYNQAWLLDPENYQPYWGFGQAML